MGRQRGHTEEQILATVRQAEGGNDRGGRLSTGGRHRADRLYVGTYVCRTQPERIAGAPATEKNNHQPEAARGGSLTRSTHAARDRPKSCKNSGPAGSRLLGAADLVGQRQIARPLPMARASLHYQSRRDFQKALRCKGLRPHSSLQDKPVAVFAADQSTMIARVSTLPAL